MSAAMREILLCDMDGVLLHPHGYHRALQDAVAHLGDLLGFCNAALSQADIAAFEAAGATSEWDSSAICAALLLDALHAHNRAAALPPNPAPRPPHALPAPDFGTFALRLGSLPADEPPAARAERLLLGDGKPRTRQQTEAIHQILRSARDIRRSASMRLFQERVLGSADFQRTYGLEPQLGTDSYLLQHDRPALTPAQRERLDAWLRQDGRAAVVFTARPSRWPDGRQGTPEAELGLQTIAASDWPFIGWGDVSWLAAARGLEAQALLKPSPVHVLAALRRAAGAERPAALQAAAALALDGQSEAGWQALDGCTVHAFEDGAAGLRSAAQAVRLLRERGLRLNLRLHGIAEQPVKRRALAAAGADLHLSLTAALTAIGILPPQDAGG